MDSNAPRRYDEQEVSMILEQASQLDTAETTDASTGLIGTASQETGRGLTLAELQTIGEEAGISAAAVARAANAIARGDHLPPERESMMGLPVGVARTVVFDRRVTEAEWERMVVLFRRTFGASGVVRGEGSLREWGNGRLRASLEPTAQGGHQLRLTTTKSDAVVFNILGTVFSGIGLLMTALLAIKTGVDPSAAWLAPLAIAACGLSAFARNAIVLPRWYAQRATQMATVSRAASELVDTGDPSVPRLT